MIHRDFKPANIILGKHGETLVVDWGLAKAVGRADPSIGEQTIAPSSSGSSETLPGSALGTPAYMSPEQAGGDLDRLGPRSDVYWLGATLYCLLTGKPPFEGTTSARSCRRVQAGDFRAPREVDPSLDKALEAVCLKAMATKPEDRYPRPGAGRRPRAVDGRRAGLRLARAVVAAAPAVGEAEPDGDGAVAAALLAGVVGLSAVLVGADAGQGGGTGLTGSGRNVGRRERRAEPFPGGGPGPVRSGGRRHQDVPHRRQRGLPAQGGEVQGAARPALEVGGGLLQQAVGALLGNETEFASRRALAASNFELAELTAKVGDRMSAAAHRSVLAARERWRRSLGL